MSHQSIVNLYTAGALSLSRFLGQGENPGVAKCIRDSM